MSRKPTKTAIKRKADRLFSNFIRSKGYCEWCGKDGRNCQLQTAHIFSRRFLITRWEPINAVCLCAGCHRKAHDKPPEFTAWLQKYLGEDVYEELRRVAKCDVNKSIYFGLIDRIKSYEHHNQA